MTKSSSLWPHNFSQYQLKTGTGGSETSPSQPLLNNSLASPQHQSPFMTTCMTFPDLGVSAHMSLLQSEVGGAWFRAFGIRVSWASALTDLEYNSICLT